MRTLGFSISRSCLRPVAKSPLRSYYSLLPNHTLQSILTTRGVHVNALPQTAYPSPSAQRRSLTFTLDDDTDMPTQSRGGGGRRNESNRHRRGGSHGQGHSARSNKFDLPWRDAAKRKADGDADNGRAHRRQKTVTELYMDEAWIRENRKLPTEADYPFASKGLFKESSLIQSMQQSFKDLRLSHDYKEAIFPGGKRGWRATVHCQLPTKAKLQTHGDGQTKMEAVKASYLAMLCTFHEEGILKDFTNPNDMVELDKTTMQSESDSMIQVYDYAARFGLVPKVSISSIKTLRKRKGSAPVQVTLELPEQNITAHAVANKYQVAEVAACMKFKQAAEEYHAVHGESSINLGETRVLNLANMKDFMDFLGRKRMSLATSSRTIMVAGTTMHESQAIFEDQPMGPAVLASSKKKSESMAQLVGAVEITNMQPELKDEFLSMLSASGGGLLVPVSPISTTLPPKALQLMRDTLEDAQNYGLDLSMSEAFQEDAGEDSVTKGRFRRALPEKLQETKQEVLRKKLEEFEADPLLADLRKKKAELPMNQHRDAVLKQISENDFSVVVGATGSGKTTQVPQILLEDAIAKERGAACNIICTQPRRIAATSVAKRVADERNEVLRDVIGHHVRFDASLPRPGGSITYCTTGILLQQLQREPDEVMDQLSHIVVDEVHERDVLIDFLLILIKKSVHSRLAQGKSVPKIVLMSATIDSDLFMRYFTYTTPDGHVVTCPSISVPGRTFPVKENFLDNIMQDMQSQHGHALNRFLDSERESGEYLSAEATFAPARVSADNDESGVETTIDWKRDRVVTADGQVVNEKQDALVPLNLIAAVVAHVCTTTQEGAILIFLPGFEEIKKVATLLETRRPLGVNFLDADRYKIFKLHSSVPAQEQAAVFEPVPEGCRKIILSTNIAETSVTIPDIQHVIDSGKLREKRYDQVRRITQLQCTWVSKSNAKQRAGRAGRVQNGNYWALFSRKRFESLRAIGLPEMLRSDLQEICLDIKAQAFNAPIRQFLSEAIEPPSAEAVDASVSNIISLGALTPAEELTSLGRVLAAMPVHPSLGKMIILGAIFGCLDPIIILGAALNERSIFVVPPERRREAQQAHAEFLGVHQSDHQALLDVFGTMRTIETARGPQYLRSWCGERFLHVGSFRTVFSTCMQIQEVLIDAGLVPPLPTDGQHNGLFGGPSLNDNARSSSLVKALLLAGTHPNMGVVTGGHFHRTPGEKNATIHPSSINATIRFGKPSRGEDPSSRAPPPRGQLVVYSTMAKSNDGRQTYLRDTTVAAPLMPLLFGGKIAPRQDSNIVEMDGWLPFYLHARSSDVRILVEYRQAVDAVLTKTFGELAELRRRGRENKRGGGGAAAWRRESGLPADVLRDELVRTVVQILDWDEMGGGGGGSGGVQAAPASRFGRDWRYARGTSSERYGSPASSGLVDLGMVGQGSRRESPRPSSWWEPSRH